MAGSERLICPGGALVDGGNGVRFEVDRKLGAGGTAGRPTPAFVVRYRGQVRAFINRCSHVPIELDWQQGQFFDFSGLYLICATHGAMYDPVTGACVGGRCQDRGLVALDVVEHDGNVFLREG